MSFKNAKSLITETFSEWSKDNASRLSAALAFYAMMSLSPLLLILVSIAGLVFGQQIAQGAILHQMQGVVGPKAAAAIQQVMQSGGQLQGRNILFLVVGFAVLLFSASGVFTELQSSLNEIFDVKPKPGVGFWSTARQRLLAFLLVLGTGVLLLATMLASTVLTAAGNVMKGSFALTPSIWRVIDLGVSVFVLSLIFAVMYKYIPSVNIEWSDAWKGGWISSVLFVIGKALIGLYLGSSTMGSRYGASSALVLLLVWIYYSALVFFFGAEFTQVYVNRYGKGIVPGKYAVPAGEEAVEGARRRAEEEKGGEGEREGWKEPAAAKRKGEDRTASLRERQARAGEQRPRAVEGQAGEQAEREARDRGIPEPAREQQAPEERRRKIHVLEAPRKGASGKHSRYSVPSLIALVSSLAAGAWFSLRKGKAGKGGRRRIA